MKLYEITRNTKITVIDSGETLFFYNVDGAYSYCTTETGALVHLSTSTEVEIVKH